MTPALLDAAPRALRIDFHGQHHRAVHGARQRLGPSHAAQAGREKQAAAQTAAKVLARDGGQDLVGTLQHALRADVLPIARREAAPGDQAALGQRVKALRRRPAPDQVAVGHHHNGR